MGFSLKTVCLVLNPFYVPCKNDQTEMKIEINCKKKFFVQQTTKDIFIEFVSEGKLKIDKRKREKLCSHFFLF